ncbi:MAG: NAD-dependent epimerase/dehydratase family protein [Clostridia bacterium]|nr:NAD-dependent epimerase/dehydratase family protein [Clostridia bacterium]
MARVFIVTGASGHLGNTIVKKLCEQGETIRCLVMPGDPSPALAGLPVQSVAGDICDLPSLDQLFSGLDDREIYVIHTAGIVSIASHFMQKVYDVNVTGTANIIAKCQQYAVKRLIYISSVHAIPELPTGEMISEINDFDPERVVGLYAKTKAEASRLVLDAAKKGLDGVVIHPSGIGGPNDYGHGHLTQLVMDFLDGRLTAGIQGGYDFVDVRDVADGVIAAVEQAKSGECYILSNRFCSVPELLDIVAETSGKKRVRTILPLWFAKATAPLAELWYKLMKQPPLFTKYSLFTLTSNALFSHQKAARELNYRPRNFRETVADTVRFLRENHRVKPHKS